MSSSFRLSVLVCLTFALSSVCAGECRVLDRFLRPAGGPIGLSALTRVEGSRYLAVDDRGGLLHELSVSLDESGRVCSCVTNRCVRLAGRTDLEGCAWDPLERRVWVSDEADTSIRQFDPATGRETAAAPVPPVYPKNVVRNRSLEALAIAPDGLRMYAANEDTLRCDGEVATTNRGGVVRIQEFVRSGAACPWTASRQFRFKTQRILGAPWGRLSLSGVSALAVDTDGSLLILEREFSRKGLPFPTFHARLTRLHLPPDGTVAKPIRTTLFNQDTGFANYEGLALGPRLPNGSQTYLLISDAGSGAEASLLVLCL